MWLQEKATRTTLDLDLIRRTSNLSVRWSSLIMSLNVISEFLTATSPIISRCTDLCKHIISDCLYLLPSEKDDIWVLFELDRFLITLLLKNLIKLSCSSFFYFRHMHRIITCLKKYVSVNLIGNLNGNVTVLCAAVLRSPFPPPRHLYFLYLSW